MQLIDIKRLRKLRGYTQKELAIKAEVSQSIIAKIESGRLNPSFTIAQDIFAALEEQSRITAKDIYSKKITSIKSTTPLKKAIALMKKEGVSQIPIIDTHVLGYVTEKGLLQKLTNSPDELTLADVMQDAPPQIALNTPLDVIKDMLKVYEIVIVLSPKTGNAAGIISRSDLFDFLLSQKTHL